MAPWASQGDAEVRRQVTSIQAFTGLDGSFDREAYKLTLKPFSQQNPELWRLLQHTAETLPPEDFASAATHRRGCQRCF